MRIPFPLFLAPWLLVTGAAFAQAQGEQRVAPSDDPDATESTTEKVPLEEIRRYVAVYNAVKEAYVDPVEDRKLMQSAVRGLLLDLDPHSAYLERRDAREFDEATQGAYTGVGVELMTLREIGRAHV